MHNLTTQTGGQALSVKVEAIPARGHPAGYFSPPPLRCWELTAWPAWSRGGEGRGAAVTKSMNHTGMPITE